MGCSRVSFIFTLQQGGRIHSDTQDKGEGVALCGVHTGSGTASYVTGTPHLHLMQRLWEETDLHIWVVLRQGLQERHRILVVKLEVDRLKSRLDDNIKMDIRQICLKGGLEGPAGYHRWFCDRARNKLSKILKHLEKFQISPQILRVFLCW
jgi:hypothetical protein